MNTIDLLRWQSFGTLASISDVIIASRDFRKDLFGGAIAYAGNQLFVGAPLHTVPVPNGSRRVGRVYAYDDAGALTRTIENPDADADAIAGASKHFGASMAGDAGTVLASAPYNFGEGAVYVLDAATGAVSMTIRHPDSGTARAQNSEFGRTVALLPGTIAVALHDAGIGGVYLFDRVTGAPLTEIVCPDCDATNALDFGDLLAVRAARLVVSGRFDDVYEFDGATGAFIRSHPIRGLALSTIGDDLLIASFYGIFRIDPDGNVVQTYHQPNDDTGPGSQYSSVVGAGDVVLAAEFPTRSLERFPSFAYVFDATTGALLTQLPDPRPDPSPTRHYTGFGAPLLAANQRIYLGSGSRLAGEYGVGDEVYIEGGDSAVFRFDPSRFAVDAGYAPARANPRFGVAVAVDGARVAAPTPLVVDDLFGCVGRVDLFDLAGPLIDQPIASDRCVPSDAVAVGDGLLVAGAHTVDDFRGAAFVYPIPTMSGPNVLSGSLSRLPLTPPTSSPGDEFGAAVAVGGNVFVGAPGDDTVARDAGIVHVFDEQTLTATDAITGPTNEGARFGAALAATKEEIVVGAPFDAAPTAGNDVPDAGRAYVFKVNGGNQRLVLAAPNPTSGDLFGASVAFDGTWVLVGAPLRDVTVDGAAQPDVGTAYLFDATSGELVDELRNPNPSANDQFGFAVALLAGHAVVGAPLEDAGGLVDAGAVYVFDPVSGSLEETLTDPRAVPGPRTQFGFALGASGDRLAIGAPEAGFVHVLLPCAISGCPVQAPAVAAAPTALPAAATGGTIVDPLVLACLGGYCDDGDPCTLERCDLGGCRYDDRIPGCGTSNTCDDTNVCNGQEGTIQCSGQLCHLQNLDCCTTTHYECTTTRAAIDGTSCDDGNPCDGVAHCSAGACVPGTPAADGDSCDDDDVCNGIAKCKAGQCQPGLPLDCEPADRCTCDPTYGCDCRPPCDDAHPCPDLPCRTNERCIDGECRSDPVVCPGTDDPCIDSVCRDDEQGCVELKKVDGSPCDDCDADHANLSYGRCEGGACRPNNPIEGFRCVAGKVLGADVCGGEAIPQTIYRLLTKRLGKLEALIDAAEHTTKAHRAAALIARAKGLLAKTRHRADRVIARELRKTRLSAECGMRIGEALTAVGNALAAIDT